MSVYTIRTFADIIAAVREEVQGSTTQTNFTNWIKRDINLVYQEVAAEKNWNWLEGNATVQLPAYINSGTVSVTQASASITFTVAPTSSQRGKYLSIDGFNETYIVESHAAGATTAKLTELYAGSTSATATYKLYTDRIPLPTDCRETTEVWHGHHSNTVEGRGKQDFRRITLLNPRAEGKPKYYYTGDFVDPSVRSTITSLPATLTRASSGVIKTLVFASALPSSLVTEINAGTAVRLNLNGGSHPSYNGDIIVGSVSTTTSTNDTITYTGKAELQESSTSDTGFTVRRIDQEVDYERYRELFLYPHLNTSRVTLNVDYVKDIFPLENNDDEPLIPIQYRSVLVYGALHRVWARLEKEAKATRNYQLYQAQIAKMSGKLQDTFDVPRLSPSKIYLGKKRSGAGRTMFNESFLGESGGSSGGQVVTGTASMAAQFGSDGVLVASSTVSNTELGYLDGATSNIQTQLDTITTLADGKIYLGNASNAATEVTPSGDVTISNSGVTSITAGVIVDADINASAAITRSKTASGTAYRILANSSAGVMSENAALTASQVVVSDANGQLSTIASLPSSLNSATLTDNATGTAASWVLATYDSVIIRYSLKRGSSNKATGEIYLSTDGTNAAIAQADSSIGTLGVTFSADISAGNLRLRYSTTSTGVAVSMRYLEEKWLA